MKPFDVSKLRKTLTKSIDGLGVGFHDPTCWINTGNYGLNFLVSGDFKKGIPLGKVTMFAGESGCLPIDAKVTIQYNNIEQNITVGELKTLYQSGQYDIEIETPDGFQLISDWYDKGVLPMVEVTTLSGLSTRCATNHLLQLSTGEWLPAAQLESNMDVITKNSDNDTVVLVKHINDQECYDFTVDHENHRYWGDGFSSHNSGKSYICSGNIIKNAQDQGIFVVLIDSENALDEQWLQTLGVQTTEDKLLKLSMAMIDDVAKTISEFMKEYKSLNESDRPKVLFVIDSLGMLLTPTDISQFEDGQLKGDLGRKAKALTALIRNCVNLLGSYNVGLIATNHTYASQSMFDPDDVISGGNMVIYASSIVVAMNKYKLKEDEDGVKTSTVHGIRSKCKIMKTRYSKPFEEIEIRIPWDTGMDPYSGLFELFVKKGLYQKSGNYYIYKDLSGKEHKYFQKGWKANTDGVLDLIMNEYHQQILSIENTEKENTEKENDENDG